MNNKEDLSMDKINELLKSSNSDDGSFYSALYDLYLFISLAKGLDNARNGKNMTLEEFHKEMEELYESTSRKFG